MIEIHRIAKSTLAASLALSDSPASFTVCWKPPHWQITDRYSLKNWQLPSQWMITRRRCNVRLSIDSLSRRCCRSTQWMIYMMWEDAPVSNMLLLVHPLKWQRALETLNQLWTASKRSNLNELVTVNVWPGCSEITSWGSPMISITNSGYLRVKLDKPTCTRIATSTMVSTKTQLTASKALCLFPVSPWYEYSPSTINRQTISIITGPWPLVLHWEPWCPYLPFWFALFLWTAFATPIRLMQSRIWTSPRAANDCS